MSDNMAEQNRIEKDLERTRTRMDDRLNELQERLSPGQVVDDLMAYFRGSDGADFGRNLMASVKNAPLPAALTGIGLTWLMASNPHPHTGVAAQPAANPKPYPGWPAVYDSGSKEPNHDDLARRMRDAEGSVSRETDETEGAFRMRVDDARGKVVGVAREVQDTADSYVDRIGKAFAAASPMVTDSAHDLKDSATGIADNVGGAAQQVADRVGAKPQAAREASINLIATISENPLVLGAIGLAVGALLGALIPQSEQEEKALGGMAAQVRDAAGAAASQVADGGSKVVQQVLDAGLKSATEHGLTGDKTLSDIASGIGSGDLSDTAKQVARDAMQAADDTLRAEGFGKARAASNGSANPSPATYAGGAPGGASLGSV
jgi:hypothetical protein